MSSDLASASTATSRSKRAALYSPLYKQIKRLLLEGLRRGEWKPGAAIPSELELASRFQVSQGTVRKAIDELAAENLLVRRQGKGTFVATHLEPRSQYRFLRLLADDGQMPTAQSRFIECRRMRAPAEIAARLGLKASAGVVFIRRLLRFASAPVVLDDIWLPARMFRGLNFERLAAYTGPLYGLFESEFGVPMTRADERLRAVSADERSAELLQVPTDSPLLLVERVSYTYGDRPVEVRRGLCVTREHYYHNVLA
ncbi:MAG TPA: GntR family transcriptional regulator [Burkholderiaceae bacterium]|nr:GntR family transcriptional regulator [Burkholderiaceae bacterium]